MGLALLSDEMDSANDLHDFGEQTQDAEWSDEDVAVDQGRGAMEIVAYLRCSS